MTRILSRIGVSYQIGLVGLIGVIGLIVVGIVYYFGSTELAGAARALEQSNSGLATLAEIKIDLLETRRSEKDFLLRRKEDYVKKQEDALAKFARDAAEFRASVGGARRAQLDKVSAAVARYQTLFGVVAGNMRKIGLDENSGLQGRLRGSVHDIEALIIGKDDGLNAAMLMMRRHEKDFFARLDRKYIDAMMEASVRFGERLNAAAIPAEQKPMIAEELTAYQ
jgi:methyl-accepting chemotaxis protein